MIAGDGACIPDGGVHAPLLCSKVVVGGAGWGSSVLARGSRVGSSGGCGGFKTKCYVCTECNMMVVNGRWFEGCTRKCSASHS